MPKPLGQTFAEFRKEFSKEYCLAPHAPSGCRGRIVRAHTVQRPSLAAIAENQHLLQMGVDPKVLSATGGLPVPQKVGVNRGSTFTGFCSHHDAAIFLPLEQTAFRWSPEQLRLLTYRAVCRELFQKRAAATAIPPLAHIAEGHPWYLRWRIRRIISGMVKGTKAGLKSIEAHKQALDPLLEGADDSGPRAVVVKFDSIPDVMCAGGVYPDEDFNGRRLQELGSTRLKSQFLAFSMFASGGRGFAAFTWEAGSDGACVPMMDSLLQRPDSELPHLLVLFAFEYLENTLFTPSWWRGLDSAAQRRLQRAVVSGLPFVPDTRGRRLALVGQDFARWKVEATETFIPS